MIKLRCLYGVKDDLHDFAEHALNTLPIGAFNAPCSLTRHFGDAHCSILHRERGYQIELVTIAPGVDIDEHAHPGVDSIEYALSGGVRFVLNGERPFDGLSDERFLEFVKGKGLRIADDAMHGGPAMARLGAVFLSFQRWPNGACQHIGENFVLKSTGRQR